MPFEKGKCPNVKGRPKGSKNKCSVDFWQNNFIRAFNDKKVGGYKALLTWITESPENRGRFYEIIAKGLIKQLPQEVGLTGDMDVRFQWLGGNDPGNGPL